MCHGQPYNLHIGGGGQHTAHRAGYARQLPPPWGD